MLTRAEASRLKAINVDNFAPEALAVAVAVAKPDSKPKPSARPSEAA
ncbi:hypothetical protein E05_47270 [Plautia stali symbiont]|nr:hypothetical protein E05_47270 [Plautia stali symbiont]